MGKGREGERNGREASSDSDTAQDPARILNVRSAIISALGLTGQEVNTSGTFIVGGMGEHDLPIRLAIWGQHQVDDKQIVMVIKATFARQRQTEPTWLPRSLQYFDGAISDFAKRMSSERALLAVDVPPTYADPNMIIEDAALKAEWASLGDLDDPETKQKREVLLENMKDLKRRAADKTPPADAYDVNQTRPDLTTYPPTSTEFMRQKR